MDPHFLKFLFETHEYQLIAEASLWIEHEKARISMFAQQTLEGVHHEASG
jgi:hypothetical protein